MTGHTPAPVLPGEPSPYDTCEACGKPIRDRAGEWVTMIGANRECYGGMRGSGSRSLTRP